MIDGSEFGGLGYATHRLLAVFDAVEDVSFLKKHCLNQLPVRPGSGGGSNLLFQVLDLYWLSTDSSDLRCKSKQSKR